MTNRRVLTAAALGAALVASAAAPAQARHGCGRTYVYNGHTGYYTGGTACAQQPCGTATPYAQPYAAPTPGYAPQAYPAYTSPQTAYAPQQTLYAPQQAAYPSYRDANATQAAYAPQPAYAAPTPAYEIAPPAPVPPPR